MRRRCPTSDAQPSTDRAAGAGTARKSSLPRTVARRSRSPTSGPRPPPQTSTTGPPPPGDLEGERQAEPPPQEAAARDEHQALAPLGVLVGELHGDAAAERVAGEGRPLELERAHEVAQHVGHAAQRVVAGALGRAAMAGEVDGEDAVPSGERREHGLPRLPVAADAVDEQQRGALAGVDVGEVAAVDTDGLGLQAHGDVNTGYTHGYTCRGPANRVPPSGALASAASWTRPATCSTRAGCSMPASTASRGGSESTKR